MNRLLAIILTCLATTTASGLGATVLTINTDNNPLEVTSNGEIAIFAVTEVPTGSGITDSVTSGGAAGLSMTTADLNFTTIDGVVYAEFVLNLNEPGNPAGSVFDIEDFEITSSGESLWKLDATIDYTINVNQSDVVDFNNGGNDVDVAIYVPVSALELFDGDSFNVDLTISGLSSGGNPDVFANGAGDGTTTYVFPSIPEPTTIGCLILSFALISFRRARQ